LVETIGDVGPLLVGAHSDFGQRVGAAGVILAAIGFTATGFSGWLFLASFSSE